MKHPSTNDTDYETFLSEVKERIRTAQYEALKTVNKDLLHLYWDLGKMIVEKQNKLSVSRI